MRTFWLLQALLLGGGASWAGDFGRSVRGTTTSSFLKLAVGARAAAMGEAYTAAADEASALYWNPAALVRIERRSVTLMHAASIDESAFDYAAYAHSFDSAGSFAIGTQYLSAGRITETDSAGNELGAFYPADVAVSFGYAHRLGASRRSFSVGATGKFIRSRILASAQTAAVDLGLLSPAYLDERLRLGLTASNIGGKLRFEQACESLPVLLKVGAAYRLGERWLAALDVGLPKDNGPYAAVGVERFLPVSDRWSLAARAGFNTRTLGDVDGLSGASLGFGITNRRLSVDYGFLSFGGVGMAHRLSLTLTQ